MMTLYHVQCGGQIGVPDTVLAVSPPVSVFFGYVRDQTPVNAQPYPMSANLGPVGPAYQQDPHSPEFAVH